LGSENLVGDDGVDVRVEVRGECTEGLDRRDTAGTDVGAAEKSLEGLEDGVVGGAGQQAEEATLAIEKAAQGLRDGEGPVSVRQRSQDIVGEFFGKQGGTLGLATAAEISGAAG